MRREDDGAGGVRASLRAWRWRVAGRLGRALVGGRMDEIAAALGRSEWMHQAARDDAARTAAEIADLRRALDDLRAAHAEAVAAAAASAAAERRTLEDRLASVVAAERTRAVQRLRTLAALFERFTTAPPVPSRDEPLVSVVMAVRNRAHSVAEAVESVRQQTYPHWELVVVDDGSDDGTPAVLDRIAVDARIRVLRIPHGGPSAARNHGLAAVRGDVVAYLDSDNAWSRGWLHAVASAFDDPAVASVYGAQLVLDEADGAASLRAVPWDRAALEGGNYVDLNAFAHRRSALPASEPAFDETLTRLGDWDLVLRVTASTPARRLDVLAGRYVMGRADHVSRNADYHRNCYWVRRKLERPVTPAPRVLYLLWHYPQLSESYVRAEIRCLGRWGADVTVWRGEPGPAPYASEVPVLSGDVATAIARTAPDALHVHWLGAVAEYREAAARFGIPMTVRGHGFDFSVERAREVLDDPLVARVFLFPHQAAAVGPHPKLLAMPVAFAPDLRAVAVPKDRRLVVRCAAGLPTKDLTAFPEIARRCPRHRFVLAVTRAARHEGLVDELLAANRALGSPVEIRVDQPHEAVAALLSEAGVYLHTFGALEPYGMPISIAEAMSHGCAVVARRAPGAAEYVGDAGWLYETTDEAVRLVEWTATWTDAEWTRASIAAVDWSWARHADANVLRPLLDELCALRDARAAGITRAAG